MADADGVHVGQEDMPVEDARRIVGPKAIVGVSTHDDAQLAVAARTSATYLAVGPVYGTLTKDTGYNARGAGARRPRRDARTARRGDRRHHARARARGHRRGRRVRRRSLPTFFPARPETRVKAFLERLNV
jgi:hypothetical protein